MNRDDHEYVGGLRTTSELLSDADLTGAFGRARLDSDGCPPRKRSQVSQSSSISMFSNSNSNSNFQNGLDAEDVEMEDVGNAGGGGDDTNTHT